jgi:hypothetical protein
MSFNMGVLDEALRRYTDHGKNRHRPISGEGTSCHAGSKQSCLADRGGHQEDVLNGKRHKESQHREFARQAPPNHDRHFRAFSSAVLPDTIERKNPRREDDGLLNRPLRKRHELPDESTQNAGERDEDVSIIKSQNFDTVTPSAYLR